MGPLAALSLTLATVGITGSLGAWQLSRAHQKESLEALQDERGVAPPIVAPSAIARSADAAPAQWQRRVVLTGRWRPEFTLLLDNRTQDGLTGFEVVTPLQVAPDDTVIVVRGLVARDRTDPRRVPPFATPAQDVTIHGHLAPPPEPRMQLGPDAPGRIRQNLDLAALQRESGAPVRPLVVIEDADDPVAVDGLARHWPAPAVTAGRNYGYAAQWFAMAAAAVALYTWLQFIRPRRRRPPAP